MDEEFPPEVVLLETRTPKKLREIVADHAQTAVLRAVHPVIHVSLTVALQSVVGFGSENLQFIITFHSILISWKNF